MAEYENKERYRAGSDSPEEPVRSQSLTDELQLDGLSLYEKKCILINREIDSHGMGKYQWWIWGLCGFGYMLDLLWAQAFGLVLSPLKQELGFASKSYGSRSPLYMLTRYQMTRPATFRSRSPLDLRLVSTISFHEQTCETRADHLLRRVRVGLPC